MIREILEIKDLEVGKIMNRDMDFQNVLGMELKRSGLGLGVANRVLRGKLKCKKPVVMSKDSYIEYVDDNAAQMDAVKTVYQLHGLLKNNSQINVDNRRVTFNNVEVEKLREIAHELKELNKEMGLDDRDGEVVCHYNTLSYYALKFPKK